MRRILLLATVTIMVNTTLFAKKWDPEIICSTDPLIVEPFVSVEPSASMKYDPEHHAERINILHTK